MSSSATASAGSSSSAIPHPASTSAGLGSGAASQEIQAVPPTPFENLCLSRPGGLPIIEGLSPTDAVVFYYGEYQPESDNRRTSRSRSVGDYQLRYVGGAEKWKEEAEKEEAGTDAKDKQPAAPSIASEPPRATYDIVSLAEIDSATGARGGNIPWLKDNRPAHVQIPYIQTFTLENIKKLFDSSPPILYSRELFQTDGKDPFINAVRVRAEESSHNIFVGLPYLGCGLETNDDSIPQDGIENGMKLPYYGGSEGVEGGPDYGMRVWQSWQILFDDTRLALIKSPDSPGSKCAPLFGHQTTFGPLHALALIIGNLFRHEVQPLEVLRAKVDEDISNIEAKMSEHVLLEPDQLTGVVRRDYRGIIRVSDGLLERHILNLKTIIVILRKQLSILRDLETITTNQQDPRYRPAFGNPVPLPKFDGQSEQLKNARAVFEQLIVERGRVLTDMNTMLDDVKKRRSELRGELRMVREQLQEEGRHNLTVDLSAALERQGETTVKMKNIMARQGQTVSFFAFITAVFLPLEFFAQYLTMTGVSTHRGFWMIAGPVTVGVMMLLVVFMFWDDDKIKDLIAGVTPWTRNEYRQRQVKLGIRDIKMVAAGPGQNEKLSKATGQPTSRKPGWLRGWLGPSKAISASGETAPLTQVVTADAVGGVGGNGRAAGTTLSVPHSTESQTSRPGGSPRDPAGGIGPARGTVATPNQQQESDQVAASTTTQGTGA